MNKTIALIPEDTNFSPTNFNLKQIDILKNSICRGVSDEEFHIFLMACQKTQLDPFMKQIYAVKRKARKPDGSWGETMTIQTGIDGYRLIAERTHCYAPGPEPTYHYDSNGQLQSATAHIKKQTRDGTWHTVSASAYLDEYQQSFVDNKTGEKKPTGLWANMARTMLAKCAESQALRKAFPSEMSGVYTKEEMTQADIESLISKSQAEELEMILNECGKEYKEWFLKAIRKKYYFGSIYEITTDCFPKMKETAIKKMEDVFIKQKSIEIDSVKIEEIVNE